MGCLVPMFLEADGVESIDHATAARIVIERHYLHRKPPTTYAFGLYHAGGIVGVCTFGTPPSRHLQIGACPTDPSAVIELNRLWVDDVMPRNTESRFVTACLRRLPPRIVVSYADTAHGHYGYIYRAMSWRYAGWTDMERKTPRLDYVPAKGHSRDAFRNGYVRTERRKPKAKYWTTTGNPTQRRHLARACRWPTHDWRSMPVPGEPR